MNSINESTPLLTSAPAASGSEIGQNDHNEDTNHFPTPQERSFMRTVRLLIVSAITLSGLAFIFCLTVVLAVLFTPYESFFDWDTKDAVHAMLPMGLLCVAACIFDIFKRATVPVHGAWLVFNLILDFGIVFFGLAALPGLDTSDGPQHWGSCTVPRLDPASPEFWQKCEAFGSAMKVLMILALACNLLLLVLHFVFLVMDFVFAVKALSRSVVTWRVPPGQITLEFTIKVLRQEENGRLVE